MCLCRVERQVLRLVGMRAGIDLPAKVRVPALVDPVDDPADRLRIIRRGAEVPAPLVLGRLEQRLRELEVAAERIEHVLPGADRLGVAYRNDLTGERRSHDVGNQAVLSPVAPADHIAGAGGAQARTGGIRSEERAQVGVRHQLGAALGAGVRIVSALGVVLHERTTLFPVVVALVRRDVHDGPHTRRLAHGLKHVHRAHHIGLVRSPRVTERPAHERLSSHVDDDLRGDGEGLAYCRRVTDVAPDLCHSVPDAAELVQGGRRGNRMREACDLRAHPAQPEREPGSLEAGMASDQDAPVPPEAGVYCHVGPTPMSSTGRAPTPRAAA